MYCSELCILVCFRFFPFVLHWKSGTTNNDRTGLNDISYWSQALWVVIRTTKFSRKFFPVSRKTGLKFLIKNSKNCKKKLEKIFKIFLKFFFSRYCGRFFSNFVFTNCLFKYGCQIYLIPNFLFSSFYHTTPKKKRQ